MVDMVHVRGAKELRRSLKRAGQDTAELKAAHAAAARIAADASADLAPKRSGRMAGTIRAAGTNTAGIIRAGRKSVPYAGPVHWGWPARNIKAQPFLSQGATNSEGKWLPVYSEAVEGIIQRIEGA